MSHKLPAIAMAHANNARAYALGTKMRNGFHIRRVVWGRLMACMERHPGEQIRRAIVLVERER